MDMYGNKLVNMIATKLVCASSSNLADMLTMVRGWTLLILEVRGQRSRSQWTHIIMFNVIFGTLCIRHCGQDTVYSLCPIAFTLHMYVVGDQWRNPIDFGSRGQRSRSTLALCIRPWDTIQTTVLAQSLSNFTG